MAAQPQQPGSPGEPEQGATPDDVLRELRELGRTVTSLQKEVRSLGGVDGGPLPGWEDDAQPVEPGAYAWLSELRPQSRPSMVVPRFLLEAAFLAAAAALAVAAELEALEIVAVMAGAWALVALCELLASRAERRRDALHVPPPVAVLNQPAADPAWFSPPVERTLLEPPGASDSETAVTRLPAVEVDATAERPAP